MHKGQHIDCKPCGEINVVAIDKIFADLRYRYETPEGRAQAKQESIRRTTHTRKRVVKDWL